MEGERAVHDFLDWFADRDDAELFTAEQLAELYIKTFPGRIHALITAIVRSTVGHNLTPEIP
jgi:hypothetical protein